MDLKIIFLGIAAVILIFYIYQIWINRSERFEANDRATIIYRNTKQLFSNPKATYEDYKRIMTKAKAGNEVDAVEFLSMKQLYKKGQFDIKHIVKEMYDINPSGMVH